MEEEATDEKLRDLMYAAFYGRMDDSIRADIASAIRLPLATNIVQLDEVSRSCRRLLDRGLHPSLARFLTRRMQAIAVQQYLKDPNATGNVAIYNVSTRVAQQWLKIVQNNPRVTLVTPNSQGRVSSPRTSGHSVKLILEDEWCSSSVPSIPRNFHLLVKDSESAPSSPLKKQ